MIPLEIDAVRIETYASDAEIESTRSKHVASDRKRSLANAVRLHWLRDRVKTIQ